MVIVFAHSLHRPSRTCLLPVSNEFQLVEPLRRRKMVYCLWQNYFMRDPGIEPGSVPWQGTILPLNQPRDLVTGCFLAYR